MGTLHWNTLGAKKLNPIPKDIRWGEGGGGGPGSPDTSQYTMTFLSFASSPGHTISQPDRGGFFSGGDFTKQGMRAACQLILNEAKSPSGTKPIGWPDAPYPLPPGWCVGVTAQWADCSGCVDYAVNQLGPYGVTLLAALAASGAGLAAGIAVSAAAVISVLGGFAITGVNVKDTMHTLVSQYACSNAKQILPLPLPALIDWAKQHKRTATVTPTRTAVIAPRGPTPLQYRAMVFGVPDYDVVAGGLGEPPVMVPRG